MFLLWMLVVSVPVVVPLVLVVVVFDLIDPYI